MAENSWNGKHSTFPLQSHVFICDEALNVDLNINNWIIDLAA